MNFLKKMGDSIAEGSKKAGNSIAETAKRASVVLAPGINVRNESDITVLFVMSQLTPLYWKTLAPGETTHIDCGRGKSKSKIEE